MKNFSNVMDNMISFMQEGVKTGVITKTQVSNNTDMNSYSNISSVYILSYIIHSLKIIEEKYDVKNIITELTDFLISQSEEGGIWRFFGKKHKFPPPDFDDTCCILAALQENQISLDTRVWDLLRENQNKSGVYYTWMVDDMNKKSNYHVDCLVNTNILYCSATFGLASNRLIDFVNNCVLKDNFQNFSRWTASENFNIYVVTRAYRDGKVQELRPAMLSIRKYLMNRLDSHLVWGNYLDTLLALSSLINIGSLDLSVLRILNYLIENRGKISLIPYPIFRDLTPNYYGSFYFTAAILLEVLYKIELKDFVN